MLTMGHKIFAVAVVVLLLVGVVASLWRVVAKLGGRPSAKTVDIAPVSSLPTSPAQTPSSLPINPFAQPDLINPFAPDEYQNPFTLPSPGEYKNPFESL